VYSKDEFLTSTDERFRPDNSCIGPDGALYIADFSRGVIQHKTYLTPYLKGQIAARKLEAPTAMGRIYRITREGVPLRKPERLSSASNSRLVELLSDPDGWWRDTAQRLLVERRAIDQQASLQSLALSAQSDLTRLHALWTLDGLAITQPADIAAASKDKSPLIRQASARLAERHINDPSALQLLDNLTKDPNQEGRLQALLSIGELPAPSSLTLLAARWAAAREDRSVRSAILSGLNARELDFLQRIVASKDLDTKSGGTKSTINDLADQVLRSSDKRRLRELVEFAASDLNPAVSRWLIDRVRSAQLLHTEHPKPIALDQEPTRWLQAANDTSPVGKLIAESANWMDWPRRPPLAKDARASKLTPLTPPQRALFDRGRELFTYCAGCHGATAQGTPGQIPPLAGSPRATGNPARFAKILIHGMDGSYDINGAVFNGQMPSAPMKSDADFAAVMTFVRRSFGNEASPVSPAQVTETRRKYGYRTRPWGVSELENE
ncbi:MAG: c-type cytochrome, partial [Planctomycetota bacterium]